MQLTTRSRYGLRAMVVIARNGGEPTTSEEIADFESVSKRYLDGILASLRRKGLLESVKGHGGGYLLSRSARDITVRDVVVALEPRLEIAPCIGDPSRCPKSGDCAAREVWRTVDRVLVVTLRGLNLADLAAWRPGTDLAGTIGIL